MRILITNDDGIGAEGLRHLVAWAKTLGTVEVFAPKCQQSAKSHSIQIHECYQVEKADLFEGVEAYSVDSTPADCVRIAVLGMKRKYDLVLSGINCGPNVGGDIHYSGTVAACFEAALCGIPSIALSAAFNSFDNAVKNIGRVFEEISARGLLAATEILNVNFPEVGDDILFTRMGPAIYSDEFEFLPDGTVKPCLVCLYTGTRDLSLDTDAVMTGHISITPLRSDLTDFTAVERISKKVG